MTQPSYQQPSYPAYQVQMKPPTNVLAILALVGVFVWSIVGIVLGHIALSQVKKTGESGHGLALAAVIIGYARLALELVVIVVLMMMFGIFGLAAASSANTAMKEYRLPEPTSPSAVEQPWAGTELEGFCNALDDYDLELSDEKRFLTELLAETDDAKFAEMVRGQLDYVDADFGEMSSEEFSRYLDSVEDWPNAFDEQLSRCYAAGS